MLARARLPLNLNSGDAEGFIYNSQEEQFFDADGKILAPTEMLEDMYAKHCRTLRLGFRIKWNVGSAARWTTRQSVWKSQDIALKALLNLYDMELVDDKKHISFFHKYTPQDFRRMTDTSGERSHFFGFQTSRRSLFTNLAVVVAVGLLLYWAVPRSGLLGAVYNNTALTTAALVFAFLLADALGPWLLIRVVCALSRIRDAAFLFFRKVKV